MQQDFQHAGAHAGAVLHRRIGRHPYFLAVSRPALTQPGPQHLQLPLFQVHTAALLAVPDNLAGARLALLWRPRDLRRRHLQHGFNGDAAYGVDQFFDGQMRLLDQFNHG